MSHYPAISVVIPVYNVAKYLEQCVECVLKQTFQDFEIILVDDGSTDGSGALCDEIAGRDKRIRVIHKENEGSGPTRTRGLLEAKGEYVAFADADDYFVPTMYEELYKLGSAVKADLVISAATSVYFDKDGNEVGQNPIKCKEVHFNSLQQCREGVMELFPTTTIFDVPWNKLYRRSVAVENNLEFRRLRRCQDAVWNLDFYACCSRVVSTSKAYYYYRENTQLLVWRKFPKEYIDIQVFYFTHLRELLSSWGMYDGWVKEHYDSSFILALESCVNLFDNPNWHLTRSQQREYVKNCITRQEVTDFIPYASVRPDCQDLFSMIKSGNVSALMNRHHREVIKEKLRGNGFARYLWGIYKKTTIRNLL